MTEAPRPKNRALAIPVAFGAVIAIHLALCAHFAPPRVLFSKEPVVMVDYALHAYQVDRALTAFRGWGKLWGWDPLVLAGQPAGVAEDLTSKGTELFVILLRSFGVHAGFSFNLFIALVFLGVPFAAYASARLFDLSRAAAIVTALFWVLLWFFDSFLHWSWWIGMITWCAAAYLGVLLIALLHRAIESKKLGFYLALVPTMAGIAIIHPFSAFAVAVPCALVYLRAFRTLRPIEHGLIAASVIAAGATALVWISPALRFKHYVDTADTFFNAGAEYLFFDFLDMLKNSDHTGAPVRTVIRTLAFVAGGVMLYRWRKAGDRRALPLLALTLWPLFLAYFGAYTSAGRQTQPYRQIAVAMLAAAIPAAALLTELGSPSSLRKLEPRAKLLLAFALVLIVPRFARTVLFYFPYAIPPAVANEVVSNEPLPWPLRLAAAGEAPRAVRDWLETHHAGRGRVVIQPWVLGEYLAAATRLPTLGGLEQRNVWQADSHLFRRAKEGDLPGDALRQYFATYAVGWVVLTGKRIALDDRIDVLEPIATVGDHRIYKTRDEPSYFERGSDSVVEQSLNRVRVEDASGDEVVLRFHWLETLACRPGCQVERAPVTGDRSGFIRVSKPPPSFEIYNAY